MRVLRSGAGALVVAGVLAFVPAASAAAPTCFGTRATIIGTSGSDVIIGTSGRDVIHARSGRDRIDGRGGPDRICGGRGRDVLRGGAGGDRLDGGPGRDRVLGGTGRDECRAAEVRRACERRLPRPLPPPFSPGLPVPPFGTQPAPEPETAAQPAPEPTASPTSDPPPDPPAEPAPTPEPTAQPTPTPTATPTPSPTPHVVTSLVPGSTRAVPLSGSNAPGMLGFTFRHVFNATTTSPRRLPRLEVPRSSEFDGFVAAEGFQFGAWLSPSGGDRFVPRFRHFQNGYFENQFQDSNGPTTLQAGDRLDFGITTAPRDTALTWEGPRGTAYGRLEWDLAKELRTVSGRVGGVERSMTATFFRADLVARGGDVDARTEFLESPKLTFDLPEEIGPRDDVYFDIGFVLPHTQYIDDITVDTDFMEDTLTLSAVAKGYIREAREVPGPGGIVKEWHLPIHGIIYVSQATSNDVPDPTDERVALAPGAPARVISGGPDGERRRVLQAGDVLVRSGDRTRVERATEPTGAGGATRLQEVRDAADVLPTLSAPKELTFDSGLRRVRVNPNHRGTGILALEEIGSGDRTQRFADAISVPFVRVGVETITLDRSRLRDLHYIPSLDLGGRLTTGSLPTGASGLGGTYQSSMAPEVPGSFFEAIYDIGGRRRVFIAIEHYTDFLFQETITLTATVETAEGERIPAAPFVSMIVPPADVKLADGTGVPTERALAWGAGGDTSSLRIGRATITASTGATQGRTGVVRVLRASRPLAPDAQPDVTSALAGEAVALLFAGREDDPGSGLRRVILTREADPRPEPKPLPIDKVCGPVPVTDATGDAATDDTDIVRGWFSSDGRDRYATLELAALPERAPAPLSTLTYSLTWRDNHVGGTADATVDFDGAWTFTQDNYGRGADPSPEGAKPTTGEVDTARRLIRIRIPGDRYSLASFGSGLWRDSAARVVLRAPEFEERLEAAPDTTNGPYGTGGDWVVGTCGS